MRRTLLWYLPLGVALCAAIAFGGGFYSFVRGDLGAPVSTDAPPARAAAAAATAPREEVAPIIVGDSVARGTGDSAGLGIGGRVVDELRRRGTKSRNIVNIGINGARTRDLIQQLASPNVQTLLGESNVVIVSIGGNDLWADHDWRTAPPSNPEAVMTDVADRVEQIVRTVRRASPGARVFVIGLYNPFTSQPFGKMLTPFVNRWNSMLVERFALEPRVVVVQTSDIFAFHDRLSDDRFHPGDQGYELIARRIADAI